MKPIEHPLHALNAPAPDVNVTHLSPTEKRKGTRPWSQITGITLHQTAVHNFPSKVWPRVTAHLGVHSDGQVYWIHPLQAYLWSSNGFNASTIAIEVAGNFRRLEGSPGTFWKPGGGPSELTPVMIDGLRRAIRFICAEVERHGGAISRIQAHRQASADRAACPGEAIWREAGVWAQLELGLDDGGDGFKIGDGRPIPREWDERRGGAKHMPLAEEAVCDCAHVDDEFPDDEAIEAAARVRRGVVIRSVPAGVALTTTTPFATPATSTRRRRSFSRAAERDLVVDALTRDQLQLVDTVRLSPNPDARRGDRRRAPAGEGEALSFDVPVNEDERAIALVERDGAYQWLIPRQTAAHGLQRFDLPATGLPATNQRRGSGWWGRIKLSVFRFVVGGAARLAVWAYERGRREGFVELRGPHLNDWIAIDEPPPARRVLLLLHGTFSDTVGGFGALTLARGQQLVTRARASGYCVLGYDHHTLGKTPAENAEQLAEALVQAGLADAEIDIVCHSRGGLVARSLAHALDRRGARPIRRVACVATTEDGTKMADPTCWGDLADVVTNLSSAVGLAWAALGGAALATIAVEAAMAGVAALVKVLAGGLLDGEAVPGLAAMTPGAALRAAYPPWSDALCRRRLAVYSNFAAGSELLWVADRIVDRLFADAANDLVVDNASTRFGAGARDVVHEVAGGTIHHTGFFAAPEVVDRLVSWFDLAEPARDDSRGDDQRRALDRPRAVRGDLRAARRLPAGVVREAATRPFTALWMRSYAPAAVRAKELFWVFVDLAPEPETLGGTTGARGQIDPSALVEVELVARNNAEVGTTARAVLCAPAPGAAVRVGLNARALELGDVALRVVVRQRDLVVMHTDVNLEATTNPGEPLSVVHATDNHDLAGRAAPLPDHQLEIITLFEPGAIRLRYNFHSPSNGVRGTFESGRIAGDLARFTDDLYDQVEREWDKAGGDPTKFERILPAIGSMLFTQLLPPSLRELLWRLRDDLAGLQLVSDEQFIPWELVFLTQPDGRVVDGSRFFAELGLVRALWDATLAPTIRVRDAFVVVPDYPAEHALPASAAEQATMQRLFKARLLNPRSQDVVDLVGQRGSFDLLHFVCHGEISGGDAELMLGALEDGEWSEDNLVSGEIAARGDMRGDDGERPLVFINACSVGRGQQLLTSMGGWASSFLGRGAGAVVAPLWSVGDRAARHFAEAFYTTLLAGGSFTQAAAQARVAARRNGDPTWLAYAIYADPHGRVVI